MLARDLYMRHTDGNGVTYVMQHRVWDAKRFIEAQTKDAEAANASGKDGTKHKVEQITEDQYLKEKGGR